MGIIKIGEYTNDTRTYDEKVMRRKIRNMLNNLDIMEVRMIRFNDNEQVTEVKSYHLDTEYRNRKFVYTGNVNKTIVSWDGDNDAMNGIIYETIKNPSAL